MESIKDPYHSIFYSRPGSGAGSPAPAPLRRFLMTHAIATSPGAIAAPQMPGDLPPAAGFSTSSVITVATRLGFCVATTVCVGVRDGARVQVGLGVSEGGKGVRVCVGIGV